MKKNALVSYCIFTYNQEKYIEDCLKGALSQTYSPLEIIVSDDFSTDKTYEILKKMQEEYEGPHKIIINRNKKNLGIGQHVSKILYELTNGDYCILLGGDDISTPNHVERAIYYIEGPFKNFKMLDFNANIIDSKGNFKRKNKFDYNYKENKLIDFLKVNKLESFAPGRLLKKELLKSFEPISSNCPTEDVVLILRSLLLGGFVRIDEVLVNYRRHENNISNPSNIAKFSNLAITAQFTKDVIHLFNNNHLNEKLTILLLKRIILEFKLRNIQFINKWYNKNPRMRLLLVNLYKLNFRVKSFFVLRKIKFLTPTKY